MNSIALVDCNSFFCSCEIAFRPELRGKAVVVLSNNDGCAVARTPEAKALGIKMAEPFFKFRHLYDQKKVHVFSSNFSLYSDMSKRVMTLLAKSASKISQYSIDEAFIDFSGIKNKELFAHELKDKVFKQTGIPIGIGIAPTKVLSKLANNLAKRSQKANGVVNLHEAKLRDIALKRTLVEDIWGVGNKSAMKLRMLGLRTAYDFAYYSNEKQIDKIFGKLGISIKNELLGESIFDFSQDYKKKKSIISTRSFANPVYDLKSIKESIASHVSKASQKLREQDSLCSLLQVYARTSPFDNSPQLIISEQIKLDSPTNDARKLTQKALKLIEKHFKPGYKYKKAGIGLGNFYDNNEYQLDLFYQDDSLKEKKLMQVMDHINKHMGVNKIKIASCGLDDQTWRMNRNIKSPRYTTSWEELLSFN